MAATHGIPRGIPRAAERLLVWGMVLVGLVMAATAAAPARAQLPDWTAPGTGAWVETPEGRVRLIAARRAINDDSAVRLGLDFDLADGWKVYWRSPGDAGYPPSIDWTGSENLEDAHLLWPAPQRFSVLGIETVGYDGSVLYPIAATVSDPGQGLRLRASVDYLTCKDICVPRAVALSLDLAAGPGGPSGHAQVLNRAESAVPGDGAAQGLSLEEAVVEEDGSVLRVAVRADPPLADPDLFVEGPEGAWFGAPTVADDGADLTVLWTRAGGVDDLRGVSLTLTVVDGARGLEANVTPDRATGPAPLAPPAQTGAGLTFATLATMLGLALGGGLILNLMPCVLPVLSLKVLGVMGHGGASRSHARASFLMSAAGIIASFVALGGAAVAVKAAGMAVGWGIQFQQPWFLVAMVVLLSLFAANLWGLFEIGLPGWLADAGGGSGREHGSLWGAFGTGAFATLLATPCSAPFLGTAVGFALSRGWVEILLIFLTLGVGMALPYLLVAARPGWATRLPRPGRWMLWLKGVLGVALAGTAVWLLTVLAAQVPPLAAALVGALMVLMVLVVAVPARRLPGRPVLAGLAALAALALPAWADRLPGVDARHAAGETASVGDWRPLDPAAIPDLVAGGQTVFVDVTADWCVTCQVNKRMVLDRSPIAERLAASNIILMRGDWTRPDDAITAYLAGFGRYGIPFNAVYGPSAPSGVPLPELLTNAAVLKGIETATAAPGSE
ncbi:protein-disulfide reductase DsbD family protein [Rhodospira trueperi]|uniref:Suppressor for copper-sensitivity B n=1 Tax=Rhodospira trueperi TaxID=69960 RepID=A0A1G6Z2I5_9PROT|nr:protein-disulfide reductase DsbD domain-containing protein [Rhodospira trueperi]SDD96722.1 suppressor for copper-sensitivity B [Rhodospira trueperi]